MMENPDYDDTNDSNGSVKDDGVNDDIDAESLILGVKGQIREAEVRLRGEHEVGEGDGYAGQGLADGNYAEESVVISGVDEVTSRDMNNQIKNSVAEDTTPSYKAAVGRKNIAATKAALKQDDGQPVMMPRPPSKPKEKTVVDKKEATEQGSDHFVFMVAYLDSMSVGLSVSPFPSFLCSILLLPRAPLFQVLGIC